MKETGVINNKKHYHILLIVNKDIYKVNTPSLM
ncbi:hypothetical protein I4905_03905 [Proteus mirabilis]|nr:hypothetical protein [Proteus mirabilis]MBG2917101.1 hypothetical protein [Proteus mirabilis]MBG2987852.1 hypothetical protein [Proteus mirabilis]MBI6185016.1 hypothetical protein [Proteus mirabilis]MBI6536440.1 hypothetical protein [Proteus mirabilis]